MTPEEFQEFLDRLDLYGGRLEAWPEEARGKTEALLRSSPEARAQLSAMQRAEAVLLQPDAVATNGVDTIANRAMQAPQHRAQPAAMRRRLPWAVAGMIAMAAGVYVGALPRTSEGPTEIVTSALDQSGGHDVW